MQDGPVGVIEGFYGPPWSWAARREVAAWCAARGMTEFVYAPKDDPKHRSDWREPYSDDELAGFESFAASGTLALGFAISPGLSMAYGDDADRTALGAKVDQVVAVGATHVVLALEDIPFGGEPQGAAHAAVTTWLHGHLAGRARLSVVPTEYVGTSPSPYLAALAAGLPEDVPVGWTGMSVVNDEITVAQAEQRAAALGGRRPLLWDNYPVNDGPMADRLFLGPLRGREPGLAEACSGYCANPMVQPLASRIPLASIAAWLRGADPDDAWTTAAADLGCLAFASACDGVAAREAVATGDLSEARRLFTDAAACGAPGLEDDAGPWLTQVHRDAHPARVAREGLGGDHDVERVLGMAMTWQRSRRAEVSVFGPRCSIRPSLGQADDGTWLVRRDAVEHDANAIDDLVRRALVSLG